MLSLSQARRSWTSHLGFLSMLPTLLQEVIIGQLDASDLGKTVITHLSLIIIRLLSLKLLLTKFS